VSVKLVSVPQYCAGCFNQQTDLRHVEFPAALDRGFYSDGVAVPVSMDDAIFCENCVREAGEAIGMSDDNEKDRQIHDLTARVSVLERERDQQQRYADTLEDAVGQKGVRIDHRKKPRQLREEVAA
jgi:hypothetical protein